MKKIDTSVGSLVGMIKAGELRLPEMQRRYVWTAPRVRDLLDSLYRGYPSGMILVWETDREMPSKDLAVEHDESPFRGHKLLLDGQQRLTSLTAILRGEPVVVRNRKKPIDVLFNLNHADGPPTDLVEVDEDSVEDDSENGADDDETNDGPTLNEQLNRRTFVVANGALLGDPHWVRVSDVFGEKKTDGQLLNPLIDSLEDPLYDKFSKRLQALRKIIDYPYVMQVLDKDLAYEEVAEIFVRVNSLGVKLRGSDLALAQITARWPDSLKLLEKFQEECEEKGFPLDLGLIVRALVVFTSGQSRFRAVARLSMEKLKAGWEETKRALQFSISFLRANARIEDPSLLSSLLLVISVGAFARNRGYALNGEEESSLKRWLYVASARGHYSGSSETTLDADLSVINKGGSAEQLIETLIQRFGRLEITASDLVGRGQQSPFFGIVYLALKAQGAKDWKTRLALSLHHHGKSQYIEYHHIFPKAILKKAGYEKSAINEIANMAFLNGSTNKNIAAKPAADYLANVVAAQGEVALKAQCVPTEPHLWEITAYTEFLTHRRRALADAMNDFVLMPTTSVSPLSVEEIIAIGETDRVEFKASARWDYRESKPNKGLEGVITKTVAGFLNANGGVLLIGVDDAGSIQGLDADYQTFSGRKNSDGYQQFLINLLSQGLDLGKETCTSNVSIAFPAVEEKELCKIDVRPSRKPVYVIDGAQRRFYVRTGNTTQDLNTQESVEYIKGHWAEL